MSKIILTKITTPDTPASGKIVLYAKTDDNPYLKTDAGVEMKILADSVGVTATPTANAIPKADAAGKLAVGWMPTGALILQLGATLTIATGSITVTDAFSQYQIDTEAAAATDDLTAIVGGTTGQVLILRTSTSVRDVTVKDGGTLLLAGDFVMGSILCVLTLVCITAPGTWIEIARSTNT